MGKEDANYIIQRLDEFMLCNKYQNEIKSIDDGMIILSIVCDEVDSLKL